MTQICSAIKPNHKFFIVDVLAQECITLPEDFISFGDDVARYNGEEAYDDVLEYYGYNQVICKSAGVYEIPYNARWFFFTKDLTNAVIVTAPADICDAIPSYIVSQCFKIDDEGKIGNIQK